MNRDETIALFERCEAARADAKAKALAEGKSEDDARAIAHEAAKAIWNGWAEAMLAERKALEESGRWAAEKNSWSRLEPKNDETRVWLLAAEVNFTRCHFLVGGAQVTVGEFNQEPPVERIIAADVRIDFSSFLFPGTGSFDSASFFSEAWFRSTCFSGDARFVSARFYGDAKFEGASFTGEALLRSTCFSGEAWFDNASFSGEASFENVNFSRPTVFRSARFSSDAWFALVKFDQFAGFDTARFEGSASFYAIRGERGFSMAEARFEAVPDFIQAHFEEAPQLDNVTVVGRVIPAFPAQEKRKGEDGEEIELSRWVRSRHWLKRKATFPGRFCVGAWHRLRRGLLAKDDLRDVPARWRALKRLAIQAHDQDREHEFFAREIRSMRFAGDWPLPWPVWKASAWAGFFRFWFGILYGVASNYGRSVLFPAIWWAGGVTVAAMFYLGETEGMASQRDLARSGGSPWPYVTTSIEAWRSERPCYASSAPSGNGKPPVEIVGLSNHLRAQTSAPWEAFQLALRDGFLILYGDADTAHRTYGCLYGIELYSNSAPIAIVPPRVGLWSALHKLYSAVMIFLFGLALRNMLKMK